MNEEGTMNLEGKKYISGAKLAAEYNIESMRDGDDKEQITPYILDTLLEDSVENQIVYSIPSLKEYVDMNLGRDKKNTIAKRIKKVIKKVIKKYQEPGDNVPAKKKKDKELRAKAPKKKRISPTEKIRSLVEQIEKREERNTRLNKRDREAIRKELKKLDKVGKMSLADLIYFPDDE